MRRPGGENEANPLLGCKDINRSRRSKDERGCVFLCELHGREASESGPTAPVPDYLLLGVLGAFRADSGSTRHDDIGQPNPQLLRTPTCRFEIFEANTTNAALVF